MSQITVLFTRSPNLVSKLIRRVTWFPYSHTALTDGTHVWECNHADGCVMMPKEVWDEKHKDDALLARQLTGIACDAPVERPRTGLKPVKPDLGDINALYDEANIGVALRRQAERVSDLVT